MKAGHNIFFDEKVQRFQNKVDKYFAHFPGGSKSFLLLFVYEHAHLTADYRGRDHARSSPALSRAEAGGGEPATRSWRGQIEVFIRGVIYLCWLLSLGQSPQSDYR